MFSLFKKTRQIAAVPAWASFFNHSQYSTFLQLVGQYFTDRQIPCQIGDGEVQVQGDAYPLGRMGLVNLAQACLQSDQSDWKQIVPDHFENLKKIAAADEAFYAQVHDLS